jgi:hypothetical protein
MTDRPLTEKLGLKGQLRALILNAPKGYRTLLGPLPADITVNTKPSGRYDFVHLFVANQAELATLGPSAFAAVKPMAIFWISYPKQGGGLESDITRDHGWELVSKAGFETVTQVAVNDIWSALRFRPTGEVGKRNPASRSNG